MEDFVMDEDDVPDVAPDPGGVNIVALGWLSDLLLLSSKAYTGKAEAH